MDDAYVEESLREGFNLLKKYYPELSPKCIICHSWLLSPRLDEILSPEKNLVKFMHRFTVHPIKDAEATGAYSYVWPGEAYDVANFSETTSLQRGIKKLSLEGGFIHRFYGVITDSFNY